jgi:hypothetical protein
LDSKIFLPNESNTDSHLTSRSKYQLRYHMRVMKKSLFASLLLVHFLRRNSTHDNANPENRPPPWRSRMPGLVTWLCYQQPPAPGYLIAMGCSMRHTKDFILRLKRATKIIHLIKASILYYSLDPPNLIAPRRSNIAPPAFPGGRTSSPIPILSLPPLVWLVVVFYGRLAAA